MKMFNTSSFFVILYLLINVSAYSQAWVSDHSPSKNQINVNKNSNIVITFNRAVLESSINSDNILVNGSVKGFYNLNFSYDNQTHVLTIVHNANFKTGEKINVTITGNLRDQSENKMNRAVNWSFTTVVERGTGSFTLSPSSIITENHPDQMTSADIDNDGDIDIILNNRYSNSIDVLKNDGSGEFDKTLISSNLLSPSDIEAGDLDNDGDIDIVICWEYSDAFTVYKNNGNGEYSLSGITYTRQRPVAVKLSNFDKDGYLDLVVANWESNEVTVYKNSSNGSFSVMSYFNPGIRPLSFASGDVDNDGDMDLAVGIDWNPALVVIESNDGEGNFTRTQTLTVRDRPYSITVNNFNNNSFIDFCSSNLYDNTLSLLLNSNGNLISSLMAASGNDARKIVNGDFDADGDIDLALASTNSEFISTYRNNGNAVFTGYLTQNSFGKAFSIVSNDFDGDGDLDLATTNHNTNTVSVFKNNNSNLPIGISSTGGLNPDKFSLNQNYPNPFNPSTTINFKIPNNEFVSIKIFNSLGKEITSLVNSNLTAGEYNVNFDATGLSLESGVYYYKINAGQFTDSKKMLLIK